MDTTALDNSPREGGRPKKLGSLQNTVASAPQRLGAITSESAAHQSSDDAWSRKQELGHLIDSAANNHRRLILAQLEDNPELPSYDGEGWAAANAYQHRDWGSLIETWRRSNIDFMEAVEAVPESAWSRTCRIAGSEPLTLRFVFDDYVSHLDHHLEHILSGVEDGRGAGAAYPQTLAALEYPINPLLTSRWSPVLFDEVRAVEKHKILTMLEAARWAPSCYNDQPWQYLVFDGTNPDALARARACLVEANGWARKAPLLLLSVARENFAQSGAHNRHAGHDVGAASENLVLQAADLGLVAHQMAGYDAVRASSEFNIPDGFTPMAMIAIGYPHSGAMDGVDEKLRARQQRPRARKPLAEMGFAGKWGVPILE
jgi:nitroreductase